MEQSVRDTNAQYSTYDAVHFQIRFGNAAVGSRRIDDPHITAVSNAMYCLLQYVTLYHCVLCLFNVIENRVRSSGTWYGVVNDCFFFVFLSGLPNVQIIIENFFVDEIA